MEQMMLASKLTHGRERENESGRGKEKSSGERFSIISPSGNISKRTQSLFCSLDTELSWRTTKPGVADQVPRCETSCSQSNSPSISLSLSLSSPSSAHHHQEQHQQKQNEEYSRIPRNVLRSKGCFNESSSLTFLSAPLFLLSLSLSFLLKVLCEEEYPRRSQFPNRGTMDVWCFNELSLHFQVMKCSSRVLTFSLFGRKMNPVPSLKLRRRAILLTSDWLTPSWSWSAGIIFLFFRA